MAGSYRGYNIFSNSLDVSWKSEKELYLKECLPFDNLFESLKLHHGALFDKSWILFVPGKEGGVEKMLLYLDNEFSLSFLVCECECELWWEQLVIYGLKFFLLVSVSDKGDGADL